MFYYIGGYVKIKNDDKMRNEGCDCAQGVPFSSMDSFILNMKGMMI